MEWWEGESKIVDGQTTFPLPLSLPGQMDAGRSNKKTRKKEKKSSEN